MAIRTTIAAILAVALLIASVGVSEGQTSTSCVADLVSCTADLNSSTTPSPSCCKSLQTVVDTQLQCLCNLFRNPPPIPGLNFTQALLLPKRCNIPEDASICNASASPPLSSAVPNPPAPASASPPLSSAVPNPPAPASPGGGTNSARQVTWMWLPSLVVATVLVFLY